MTISVHDKIMLQIDLLKSKSFLLDLARSLTCFKHEHFNIPKPYIMNSEEKMDHKPSNIQERLLEKKVKQSVGWANFKDVFMVSAILHHGSSDIMVSCLNLLLFIQKNNNINNGLINLKFKKMCILNFKYPTILS